jgi:hypothetical protein
MRGGRSLLLLLVAALGLGAYIYFVESERDPAGTETKDKAFTIDASTIEELDVRATSSETATLRKTGETWALTAPVAAEADDAAVQAIISGLTGLEIERVLDDSPESLTPFGLEVPRITVTFRSADGASHRLRLGNKTPTSSGSYALVDDNPRLLLIPSFHEETFDKTPFELRKRDVLTLDRDAVDRVTLAARNAAPLEMRREGADWRITAPVAARADFSPADGLISRLATAQMSSIVHEGADPTPAQLRTFGLDRPQLLATLGAGSNTATLAIGAAKDDTAVYARDTARPMVFTVEPSLLTDLRKTPDDLRVKDIFAFNSFSATTLEVTHGATAVAYAKSAPASDDAAAPATWSRTRPDAGEVNQTALTDLMNTLSSLRADQFLTAPPASGDDIIVAVRFGPTAAPQEERVTLRKAGTAAVALRSGEPGGASFPLAEFDRVVTQLNALTGAK